MAYTFELKDRDKLNPVAQRYFDHYYKEYNDAIENPDYQFRDMQGKDWPHEESIKFIHCLVCAHHIPLRRTCHSCEYFVDFES